MNNEQLEKELLAEKDPETLMRKVHDLDPRILSKLIGISGHDELIEYIAKAIKNNPKIREKIQSEAYAANLEEARKGNQKAVEEDK